VHARALLILIALTALSFALLSGRESSAVDEPVFGIDTDTTGNTATTLGTIDVCRSVSLNDTFDVDLYVQDIPELTAFGLRFYFEPAALKLVDADSSYLLAQGAPLFEPLPDDDGYYFMEATTGGVGSASGDGVLVRITLEAIGEGPSPLTLGRALYITPLGVPVLGTNLSGAIVWVGEACPSGPGDADQDGVDDGSDNCLTVGNPAQEDRDGDSAGDWCDNDDDDFYLDVIDTCPNTPSTLLDTDDDGAGDECDGDIDGDGVANASDNAPYVANTDQADADGDSIADVIDLDADGDGVNDKGAVYSIMADLEGNGNNETVYKTTSAVYASELHEWGGNRIDWARAHVVSTLGSMQVVDLDGDGDEEVVIADPGQPLGQYQSWDIFMENPDSDVDIIVLGVGASGSLVPAPVDLDGDSELESLVWERELDEGEELDLDLDTDGDPDVRWANVAVAGIDNCPGVANASQTNSDNDASGDACDDDDDNDGFDDGREGTIGTSAISGCGAYDLAHPNPSPDIKPSLNWPLDFNKATGVLDSFNRINVLDVTSFLAPVRYLNTDVGTNPGDGRWDLMPGPGFFMVDINVADLTTLIAGTTGNPPMLGGVKAFDGPACQ
jgi:hypothetical protein